MDAIIGLILLLAFIGFVVVGVKFIGRIVTSATKPPIDDGAKVKAGLARYYSQGQYELANEVYKRLPGWPVVRQLQAASDAHCRYHKGLGDALQLLGGSYGLTERFKESNDLFWVWADHAGRIAALSSQVQRDFNKLAPASAQNLQTTAAELEKMTDRLSDMKRETQTLLSRPDPRTVKEILDSLLHEHKELVAMNTDLK